MDLALVFSGLMAAFVASAVWATRPPATSNGFTQPDDLGLHPRA